METVPDRVHEEGPEDRNPQHRRIAEIQTRITPLNLSQYLASALMILGVIVAAVGAMTFIWLVLAAGALAVLVGLVWYLMTRTAAREEGQPGEES